MTRNREIDCEDLFGCDHKPEIPISENGEIVEWRCRCGRTVKVAEAEQTLRTTLRTTHSLECPFCGLWFDVVEDDAGEPGVLHPMPICSEYDDAEDALDFMIRVRKAAERQAGVS